MVFSWGVLFLPPNQDENQYPPPWGAWDAKAPAGNINKPSKSNQPNRRNMERGNVDMVPPWNKLVQQHDETARYGCESAPNYTGKKKGATPQFHVVALLDNNF
jgi:hypothetical protein